MKRSEGDREHRYFWGGKVEMKPLYTPEDARPSDYEDHIGDPGKFPFVRGPFEGGYTGRPWRTLQYAGYGAGEDTNGRWKFLLSKGQRGLNLAFDLPTQLGLDSDHPQAYGEVGRTGVAIDTLADMEALYDGIDIGEISSAFTINATANTILAMYVAMAENRGVPKEKLAGTLQNDILKEYTARGNYIFPPGSSVRLVGDTIEYCVRNMPKMNAVNISCHMIGCGATQIQTWALMFLTAAVYIEEAKGRGLSPDDILSRITFLTNVDMNFLASVASHRAARRMWAKLARDRFGARDPKAMKMRMGTGVQTLALVDRQPLNNIARIAIMALAAALSGTQSMHLASYDESYAIPSEEATRISLMIQHILIHETDLCRTADPLGGSYATEALTDETEEAVSEVMEDIEGKGGIVKLIEEGIIQKQLAKQAFEEQKEIDSSEKVLIGLNRFTIVEERDKYESGMFELDPRITESQIERLAKVKSERDRDAVESSLQELKKAASEGENIMPYLISCAKTYCTVGEINDRLKDVYGVYKDSNIV